MGTHHKAYGLHAHLGPNKTSKMAKATSLRNNMKFGRVWELSTLSPDRQPSDVA